MAQKSEKDFIRQVIEEKQKQSAEFLKMIYDRDTAGKEAKKRDEKDGK